MENWEPINQTAVSEFLLLGLTDDPELQPLIFSLFLVIYLVTLLGNLLIILAVSSDSHLHTPMYFFLSSLSFTDICISTTIIPKMLMNIRTQSQSISYTGCFTQLTFVLTFAYLENFLLAVMAYDRYMAICHPLRYTVTMSPCLCVLLVLLSLLVSIGDAQIHSLTVLWLSFCTQPEIPHFFCELAQVIKLACSDALIDNILVYVSFCIVGGVTLGGIIFSYIHIVSSVLGMSSRGGKYKAFSTCGSHLSVVSLFYGTACAVYVRSAVTDSPRKTAVASVMYSVVPQMLNSFIYSLRNREMKEALRKLIGVPSLLHCFIGFGLTGLKEFTMTNSPQLQQMQVSHAERNLGDNTGSPSLDSSIALEPTNQTIDSQFLLLKLTDDPGLQPLLFSMLLTMYLVTVLGNLLIILAVSSDSHLHTPMYFFLSNLSFTDLCLSTSTLPKMLLNIQSQSQSIAYTACLSQVFFVLAFLVMENCLLSAMAYDRYVAICHPLMYSVIMSPQFCFHLVLVSLSTGIVDALLHTLMVLRLSFCTDPEIPHFFCELAQVIKPASSDTLINDILVYVFSVLLGGSSLSGIIFSYSRIICSLLRMPSSGRKYKAFTTCGSHLLAVLLFYGTGFGVYISSAVTDSSRKSAVASMMYSVVPQMMNPFIYSLRNRDMKKAVRKIITRQNFLSDHHQFKPRFLNESK
ncbi:LOW QUALITY PROTEIN: uncharacterized protein O8D03_007578 [Erethizon dorsatum]